MAASRREFDREARGYDLTALRTMPRYRELHRMLAWGVPYLPARAISLLELGCGTGTLTARLLSGFPHAQLTAVDLSEEMIRQARRKTRAWSDRVEFQRAPFTELALAGPFDAVVSALAIHHLTDPQKRRLFGRVARWLPTGGYFGIADDHLPEDPLFDLRFRQVLPEIGGPESPGPGGEPSGAWRAHDPFDHPATLARELEMLRQAGFGHIGVPWRFFGQAVVWAYR
ncbi:MAG: class I SAM-dependent methyltransferase [Thermoplasmata archaeon]